MKVYVENKDKDFLELCLKEHRVYDYIEYDSLYRDKLELVSLSDYTKQVRKEVCELVRVKAEDKYFEMGDDGEIPCGWVISEEKLKQIEQGQPK